MLCAEGGGEGVSDLETYYFTTIPLCVCVCVCVCVVHVHKCIHIQERKGCIHECVRVKARAMALVL